MIGEGFGCFKNFIEQWAKFQKGTMNCFVRQAQSMSGIPSMRINNGKWEIELGA